MKKGVCLAISIVCALAGQRAESGISSDAGTATGSFLEMGGGSRSLAMGGTGAALLGEPSAIWVNPGQLAGLSVAQFSFTRGNYVEGVTMNQMAFAGPLQVGVICAGLTMVDMGSITSFDSTGGATGSIEPKDTGFTAGYAVEADMVGLGVSATYINSALTSDARAVGFAVDVGGRFTVFPSVTLSAAAQHLGPAMKYGTKTSSLPLVIRGGAAVSLVSGRVKLAVDGLKSTGGSPAVLTGAEVNQGFSGDVSLSLRGGWKSVAPKGSNSGISVGGGLRWTPKVPLGRDEVLEAVTGGKDTLVLSGIGVDYAWTPMGELGVAHWFSFSLAF